MFCFADTQVFGEFPRIRRVVGRRQGGASLQDNVVHGSDAVETAEFEIRYFFPEL